MLPPEPPPAPAAPAAGLFGAPCLGGSGGLDDIAPAPPLRRALGSGSRSPGRRACSLAGPGRWRRRKRPLEPAGGDERNPGAAALDAGVPRPARGARRRASSRQPHYLEPLTFIGRTPENQIRIYKPAVSAATPQITETDAGWLLRDLSSENGTYVNGQRITERLLVDGDRVQFGTSRFVLHIAD